MSDLPRRTTLSPAELSELVDFLDDYTTDILGALSMGIGSLASVLTPSAVTWPHAFPEIDRSTAEEMVPELRSLRKSVYHAGHAALDLPDDLVRAAEVGRQVLEKLHGVPVTLSGEERRRVPNVTQQGGPRSSDNSVVGGTHRNLIQAGSIAGGVHVHPTVGDDVGDMEDPIVVGVEIHPRAWHADLIVDADPPRPMAPSGSVYVVTLQARTARAVILHRARSVIVSRRQPRRACYRAHIRGPLEPRKFSVDLDAGQPELRPEGVDFPLTISSVDPEQLWIEPAVGAEEVGWRLEIDWTCLEHHGTAVIDYGGDPFETYPPEVLFTEGGRPSRLRTGCSLIQHEPDCPALHLPQDVKPFVYGPVAPHRTHG
ncbi:hypothetical protein [Streptomyces sp. HNM1019]|uniref:hypothetical protein n=1 Tax=Streptomyces sp. HNM1019 TaxID=3424717 RepID=UPI003D76A495